MSTTLETAKSWVDNGRDVALATVVEVLAHGRPEARAMPDAAEAPSEIGETLDHYRSVDGAAKGTAEERSRGDPGRVDGLIHRRHFSDRDATVSRI